MDIYRILISKAYYLHQKYSLSNLFSVLSTVFYYTFLNFGIRNVNINNKPNYYYNEETTLLSDAMLGCDGWLVHLPDAVTGCRVTITDD